MDELGKMTSKMRGWQIVCVIFFLGFIVVLFIMHSFASDVSTINKKAKSFLKAAGIYYVFHDSDADEFLITWTDAKEYVVGTNDAHLLPIGGDGKYSDYFFVNFSRKYFVARVFFTNDSDVLSLWKASARMEDRHTFIFCQKDPEQNNPDFIISRGNELFSFYSKSKLSPSTIANKVESILQQMMDLRRSWEEKYNKKG